MSGGSDEKLMAQVRAGDEAALVELINRYRGKLLAFVAAYCRWDMALAATESF